MLCIVKRDTDTLGGDFAHGHCGVPNKLGDMTENHTVKKLGQPLKGQDGSEKSQRSLWDVRKTYEMLGGCLSCLNSLLPAKGSPL
jgi:hypothetical protein